jgi:hypothetical protein
MKLDYYQKRIISEYISTAIWNDYKRWVDNESRFKMRLLHCKYFCLESTGRKPFCRDSHFRTISLLPRKEELVERPLCNLSPLLFLRNEVDLGFKPDWIKTDSYLNYMRDFCNPKSSDSNLRFNSPT